MKNFETIAFLKKWVYNKNLIIGLFFYIATLKNYIATLKNYGGNFAKSSRII